jgi:hypothetical protein
LKLRAQVLAGKLPRKPRNRRAGRVGAQLRELFFVGLARPLVSIRLGRRTLGFLPFLASGRGRRSQRRVCGWRAPNAFHKAVDLGAERLATEITSKSNHILAHRIGAQPDEPLLLAGAGMLLPVELGPSGRPILLNRFGLCLRP